MTDDAIINAIYAQNSEINSSITDPEQFKQEVEQFLFHTKPNKEDKINVVIEVSPQLRRIFVRRQ